MTATSIITIIISAVFVLALLYILYLLNKKNLSFIRAGLSIDDRNKVQEKWQEIQELIRLGGPSRFKQAVIEADKILMFSLEKLGCDGPSAEKLKKAKWRFGDSYNDVWQAHITRNKVVHEVSYDLHSSEAKDAILKFEKGLKNLGVL